MCCHGDSPRPGPATGPGSGPNASDGGTCTDGGHTCGRSGPPGPCQCGDVRWVDSQAYCGDNARLQANLTGNCPDGPATVEILNGGTVIATINSNLIGGRVDAVWITKAPTANWRTDQIRFRVNAAGQTCTSSNVFTFRHRPVTDWELVDHDHPCDPNTFAPVAEIHDARLEASQVHYSLKLKTHGATFTAARQANAKSLAENIWNNGFSNKKFHRSHCLRGNACDCTFDCCKAGFRLDVNFVTTGAHVDILMVAAPAPPAPTPVSGTSHYGSRWYEPPLDEPSMYGHEIGHLLGQFDEYTGGAHDPSGTQPAVSATPNLMATSLDTTLLNRHYRWVLAFLNSKAAGDNYIIIPP